MSDQPIHRGGSATAKARGDRGIVIHVPPATYDALAAEAARRGLPLKDHCRRVLLAAHGIADDRAPATGRARRALPQRQG